MKPDDIIAFPVRPGGRVSKEHMRGVVIEQSDAPDLDCAWWLVDVDGQKWGVPEVMAVVVEEEVLTWV